jgi:hypothetical protein
MVSVKSAAFVAPRRVILALAVMRPKARRRERIAIAEAE